MFSFVEDPLLSFEGYLLYSVPWIFQEPKEHPKTKETVLFHKSFGGEKRTSWSFYSFLWFCCCSIAVETGAAVRSWLTFTPRIPLLIQSFQSSWCSTLRFQIYKVSLFTAHAHMLSSYPKAPAPCWGSWASWLSPYTPVPPHSKTLCGTHILA